MSKTCAVIRHVLFEDLGSFEQPITEAGFAIRYFEAGVDDLTPAADADLTVILGGPIGAYESGRYPFLDAELNIIKKRIQIKRPMIGICLGAQLIAYACGARVYPGANGKEIGWQPLILTAEGKESIVAPLGDSEAQILHWHGDTFDLPEEATLLAGSRQYPHQIYSIRNSVLAFQCHPEADPAKIEQWLIGHACELAQAGIDLTRLRRDTLRYGPDLVTRGQKVITTWLASLYN